MEKCACDPVHGQHQHELKCVESQIFQVALKAAHACSFTNTLTSKGSTSGFQVLFCAIAACVLRLVVHLLTASLPAFNVTTDFVYTALNAIRSSYVL